VSPDKKISGITMPPRHRSSLDPVPRQGSRLDHAQWSSRRSDDHRYRTGNIVKEILIPTIDHEGAATAVQAHSNDKGRTILVPYLMENKVVEYSLDVRCFGRFQPNRLGRRSGSGAATP